MGWGQGNPSNWELAKYWFWPSKNPGRPAQPEPLPVPGQPKPVRWERRVTGWRGGISAALIAIVGYAGETLGWGHWSFVGVLGLTALAYVLPTHFLSKTRGKAGTLRGAFALYANEPPGSEPTQSRRLWYWECGTWLLVIPAVVFIGISPAISLIAVFVLCAGRFLIRRVRQEWGASLRRIGTLSWVLYAVLLVMALSVTVLRSVGN